MSQRALMLAVRNRVRDVLSLDANSCEVHFDGQPKPACGELYAAIHPGQWTAGRTGDDDLEEMIGACVTITRRTGYAPQDRWGTEVLDKADVGLEALLRKVLAAVHKRWEIINAANAFIAEMSQANWPTVAGSTRPMSQISGFVEPLEFIDGGQPEVKGPDWFTAEDVPNSFGGQPNAGVAQTLVFGRARRVQGLETLADSLITPTDLANGNSFAPYLRNLNVS